MLSFGEMLENIFSCMTVNDVNQVGLNFNFINNSRSVRYTMLMFTFEFLSINFSNNSF